MVMNWEFQMSALLLHLSLMVLSIVLLMVLLIVPSQGSELILIR